MPVLPFIQRQSKAALLTEALLFVLVIGTLDYLTGYDVSMALFYGFPIIGAVWFCDKKSGLLVAIVCGIVWWWSDLLAGHIYFQLWVAIWETAVRFVFFALVAFGGAALKDKHDAVRARIALLEHSQRLEREIIDISEREQRRIGRDLHDGLCQYFAAIGCGVASLRADLLRRNLPNEAALAEELTGLLNTGVVQARDLARGLVPVHMEEAGLAAALAELSQSVSRLQNIACRFECDHEVEMNQPSAATHLYRIAQEAINNASRHGRARLITVRLSATGEFGRLEVVDDGCGISGTVPDSGGLGLNIMSYRARLIGGHLTVAASPNGRGTLITCSFPRQERNEHAAAA